MGLKNLPCWEASVATSAVSLQGCSRHGLPKSHRSMEQIHTQERDYPSLAGSQSFQKQCPFLIGLTEQLCSDVGGTAQGGGIVAGHFGGWLPHPHAESWPEIPDRVSCPCPSLLSPSSQTTYIDLSYVQEAVQKMNFILASFRRRANRIMLPGSQSQTP